MQFGSGVARKNDIRPAPMLIFDNAITGYRGLETADLNSLNITGEILTQDAAYTGISNSIVGTSNSTLFNANINRAAFNIQNLQLVNCL